MSRTENSIDIDAVIWKYEVWTAFLAAYFHGVHTGGAKCLRPDLLSDMRRRQESQQAEAPNRPAL